MNEIDYKAELIKALVKLERDLNGVADEMSDRDQDNHQRAAWALQMARSVVFGPVACPECGVAHGEMCKIDGVIPRWDHRARITPHMPEPSWKMDPIPPR
jgi:hypothetical protein